MSKINSAMFAVVVTAVLSVTHAQAQTATAAAASAPAAAPAKAAVHTGPHATTAAPAAPMDLHAPPLDHIYPSSELRYILANDESDSDADSVNEVNVKSTKYRVVVPGTPGNQLQAVPWALLHPSQAWRIFTPLVEP